MDRSAIALVAFAMFAAPTAGAQPDVELVDPPPSQTEAAPVEVAPDASEPTATERPSPVVSAPSDGVSPAGASLRTEQWSQRERRFTGHWTILRLPEMASRLAMSPLLPLLVWAEDVRLDRRVERALTNEEGTSLFLPTLIILTKDGVGVGARYSHSDIFGHGENFDVGGNIKRNLDHGVGTGMSKRFRRIDRRIGVRVGYSLDQNRRFFGIGNDTIESERRFLEAQTVKVALQGDTVAKATKKSTGFGSKYKVGYRRASLEPGVATEETPAVAATGDIIPPPPGFGLTTNYVEGMTSFSYDMRDTPGRTTRGALFKLKLDATKDVDGNGLSAVRGVGTAAVFIPLAPNRRVLVLSVSQGAVSEISPSDEIPLHYHIAIGGTSRLRGYVKRRFQDQTAFWGTAEYRYPVLDVGSGSLTASGTVFADIGRVASAYSDLFEGRIQRSAGFGLRAATSKAMAFRFQIAFSPEGTQMVFSMNESF